jgi:hypothetical protein
LARHRVNDPVTIARREEPSVSAPKRVHRPSRELGITGPQFAFGLRFRSLKIE